MTTKEKKDNVDKATIMNGLANKGEVLRCTYGENDKFYTRKGIAKSGGHAGGHGGSGMIIKTMRNKGSIKKEKDNEL